MTETNPPREINTNGLQSALFALQSIADLLSNCRRGAEIDADALYYLIAACAEKLEGEIARL